MPDNHGLIRARLGKLGLGAQREEEILREISEHLFERTIVQRLATRFF